MKSYFSFLFSFLAFLCLSHDVPAAVGCTTFGKVCTPNIEQQYAICSPCATSQTQVEVISDFRIFETTCTHSNECQESGSNWQSIPANIKTLFSPSKGIGIKTAGIMSFNCFFYLPHNFPHNEKNALYSPTSLAQRVICENLK